MTPQITFTQRCAVHQVLCLEGRACPLCAQEWATGAKVPPIRGERLEDHDGKPIEVRDA